MAVVDFNSLKGKYVISKDAYIVGEIIDLRCLDTDWTVKGIKLKTGKTVSDRLNAGRGKSMILIKPGDYLVNDVIMLPDDINDARNKISADSDEYVSLLSMYGKSVVSDDDVLVGIIDELMVDTENWLITSMKVKLDKGAYLPLNVKKGLIGSKVVSGILTSDIGQMDRISVKLALDISTLKSQIIVD